MARYPKPEGWNGGPQDASMLRTGSGGRLGQNLATDTGEGLGADNRRNELSFDEADFGGTHYGDA